MDGLVRDHTERSPPGVQLHCSAGTACTLFGTTGAACCASPARHWPPGQRLRPAPHRRVLRRVCLHGAARRQPAPAVPTASESAVAACLLRPARPWRTRDRPARLRPDDPDRRARVGLVYALWYAAMAADSVLAGEFGSLLQQKT